MTPVFFFGLVPILYFLNYFLKINLNNPIILILVFVILGGEVFWLWRKRNNIKWDKALISVIILFGLMHIIFYHFYGTMPEPDGYVDLLRIEGMAKSGMIDYQYRPFFYTAMTMLTTITKIDPYVIFTVVMIFMSVTMIIVLAKISDDLKIIGWKKFLILSTALAFPVINMEIDFFRPQNMYLIFFPVWFYLMYKEKYWWAGWIAVVGLGYHQFFIFPIVATVWVLVWRYLPKWLISLVIILIVSFGIWRYWGKFTWRWWFLDNYSTYPDNIQMGWPGIKGTAMFYGYYYGPMFLAVIPLLWKKPKDKLIRMALLMLTAFIAMSELVPRILFAYLPERFVILSDLIVLLILPVVLVKVKMKKIIRYVWVMLIITGIGASVYIAKNKGSMTSLNERTAAIWIKENTPTDAIIATQESNGVMLDYFAKRKWVTIDNIYESSYILFSKEKLKSLYAIRQYWCQRNYCDLNLETINKNNSLVYEENGVYIWKTGN